MRKIGTIICAFAITGCAQVHQEDLDAWKGQPTALLDRHPIFLTMTLVKSQTPDGYEIRNYVNSVQVAQCGGFGSVNATGAVPYATYQQFSSCVQRTGACNNIFTIKDGLVVQYTPIGSGGVRCYTDDTVRPGFASPSNFR